MLCKLYLSVRLTAVFPGGPGFVSNRMSLFWILLELRMMEVAVVVTNKTTRRAKLRSNRHWQQTNTQLFTGWICPMNKALQMKKIEISGRRLFNKCTNYPLQLKWLRKVNGRHLTRLSRDIASYFSCNWLCTVVLSVGCSYITGSMRCRLILE